MKTYILLLLSGLLISPVAAFANTNPSEPVELEMMKQVSGTIIGKTRSNLSVEISRTADGHVSEMVLPFDKNTMLRGVVKDLEDLRRGDEIKATYLQKYVEDEEGQKRIISTMAKEIEVTRSAGVGGMASREG